MKLKKLILYALLVLIVLCFVIWSKTNFVRVFSNIMILLFHFLWLAGGVLGAAIHLKEEGYRIGSFLFFLVVLAYAGLLLYAMLSDFARVGFNGFYS